MRPEKSFNTMSNWIKRAGSNNFEVIISLDESDPCKDKYLEFYSDIFFNLVQGEIVWMKKRNAVQAINKAAQAATGNIFMVVSDDTDCPENWAADLLDKLSGKDDFIAKAPDGIQDWLITMPIMDRKYYERFGYIYYPEYTHMFCDTEISCVADLTGRRINIDILFPHNHYSIGKSEKDEVSKMADATWSQGEELFLSRIGNNFGLKETPGKITDPTYWNWARQKKRIR